MKNKNCIQRISFAKTQSVLEMPDLLEVQLHSFEEFLQMGVPPDKRERKGLQAVFQNIFPILDNREENVLEFIEYYIAPPKYTIEECRERGVTYSAPLKAKLRLSSRDDYGEDGDYGQTIESDVYLGNLPLMTSEGTFIINGAERVIVSQLHRSPGAFFGESIHPNGTRLFSARVIPFRGSWVEFTTDINDVLYVYIDRRKRFPVSTLLRAIGFSNNWQIWDLFGYIEEIAVGSKTIKSYFDREIIREIVDEDTGEVIVKNGDKLDADILKLIRKAKIKRILFNRKKEKETDIAFDVINNTIRKDRSQNEGEALVQIYRELRNGDPPDIETARKLLNRMFFDEKRYDLGSVGRYRINNKLNLDIPEETTILTKEDIVAIINYVLDLRLGKETTDDIDHLGNRRIRTVGEQLANQFSIALSRMARTIKERMNIRDTEHLTPQDLVNVRTVSSVINTFFGTNQLSQFMDQVNPISELTHKRRLSALGPGGLTRERAGFEVRDVHYTHYGRLCPIETPEGPNIGLISSLSTYARINPLGFIEAPYRKVRNGKVSKQIQYLTADDEDKVIIAQANAPLNDKGEFILPRVKARYRSDYPVVTPDEPNYMDVSPNQIVSAAAALIPFLEHDDANRALMGSNMQRQAVPLFLPQAPLVGTGMESKAARDSRTLLLADMDMDIIKVSADEIIAQSRIYDPRVEDESANVEKKVYKLKKFFRTNQDTCINQKPIVEAGDHIRKGEVLADGCATEKGDLALGRNILVAFMPWHGYNFEDSIIISERMVAEDVFTSIHIEEVELQVRETKRGQEELTREIPNVSEEATKDLNENGIIRVGALIKEGDIIIGKVTPKGETELTHEDKLLKAIFGDKAGDVKNASKSARPGMVGTVIKTQLFSRKRKDSESRKEDNKRLEKLEAENKSIIKTIEVKAKIDLTALLLGITAEEITNRSGELVLTKSGMRYNKEIIDELPLNDLPSDIHWCADEDVNKVANFLIERCIEKIYQQNTLYSNAKHKIQVGDELPSGIIQLAKVFIAQKRKIQVGDKMAGRHGNKGVIGKIVPAEDMPYTEDGTPIDMVLNPLGVPSRMNLGQLLETALGWAASKLDVHFATPVFDGASLEDVKEYMHKAGLPEIGKTKLWDGRSGEPFDQKVTVGVIYMMKLSHLVEDKIHARSIGPYSLITQQPLGGKAQFGGQRFGEMEVWALEAYGASHILQEILTVKSDDVSGRSRSFEAIVKGDIMPVPGVPESFNVLINELIGLGLEVTLE
ncbi:MAG: DNA-directed RNA polymerase subunit beta [Candidatus Hatepunaea meridiana]|nr:DNA-directed RNA polymerase subunit beta [Candidatus Hatepunaea meridiana]